MIIVAQIAQSLVQSFEQKRDFCVIRRGLRGASAWVRLCQGDAIRVNW